MLHAFLRTHWATQIPQVTVEEVGAVLGEEEEDDEDHEGEDSYSSSEEDAHDYDTEGNATVVSHGPRSIREKRKLARRKRASRLSATTVRMRGDSDVTLLWRTAGVKDAHGEELHEGHAYRLVGSVRETPDVTQGVVAVTRCRLTPVER